MELKLSCSGRCVRGLFVFKSHLYGIEIDDGKTTLEGNTEFKSHLYGIEMKMLELMVLRQTSLNRTFMELK